MDRHSRMILSFAIAWIVVASIFLSFLVYQLGEAAEHISNSGGAKERLEKLWCGAPGCMEGKK